MTRKSIFVFSLALTVILLLAACSSQPEPTTDPNAVNTAVAQTLEAMPTSAPAATQPPPPTQGPTPTPIAGDPADALGPPTGGDSFDNPDSWNWSYFDNDCFKNWIGDGRFNMESKGVPGIICWTFSWPVIQNYYVETTAYVPETCNGSDRYGIVFRSPNNSAGYLYGLNCDGSYSLTGWTGEESLTLINFSKSDAINTNPGDSNRMGLLVEGNTYSLYANGVKLDSAQDNTFLAPGRIGYFVRAASDQGFLSSYEQIAVWLFDEPPLSSP